VRVVCKIKLTLSRPMWRQLAIQCDECLRLTFRNNRPSLILSGPVFPKHDCRTTRRTKMYMPTLARVVELEQVAPERGAVADGARYHSAASVILPLAESYPA
jgi:hypothetical protein